MRKLLPSSIILLFTLLSFTVSGQITFGTIDPGPYGRGSTIAVPISVSLTGSCLATDNTFELYLSDASGNFGAERKIGQYGGFFSTHINGTIPGDVATGTYKLRVKTTSPAAVYLYSGTINVIAVTGPYVGATPSTSSQVLTTDATYGWCGSAVGDNKTMILNDDSSSPTIERLSLKNEHTGVVQDYSVTAAGFNLTNLSQSYYTITVTGERIIGGNTIKSTKSYLLLNVQSKINIQSYGSPFGCIDPVAGLSNKHHR